VVVDTDDHSDAAVMQALGAAAAVYLQHTLTGGERIGISSWSSTLLAMVDAMQPRPRKVADEVVQVLGGLGSGGARPGAPGSRCSARSGRSSSALRDRSHVELDATSQPTGGALDSTLVGLLALGALLAVAVPLVGRLALGQQR